MKKSISIITAFLLILNLLVVFATGNEVRVTLDGTYVQFDTPPKIVNNRVMVPVRTIFEALGTEVFWDEDTQTIIAHIINDEIIVRLTIGSYIMFVDGFGFEIDVPPIIINDRALVPVRIVSGLLGTNVEWDEEASTVLMRTSF